jgi:hypothetical protein
MFTTPEGYTLYLNLISWLQCSNIVAQLATNVHHIKAKEDGRLTGFGSAVGNLELNTMELPKQEPTETAKRRPSTNSRRSSTAERRRSAGRETPNKRYSSERKVEPKKKIDPIVELSESPATQPKSYSSERKVEPKKKTEPPADLSGSSSLPAPRQRRKSEHSPHQRRKALEDVPTPAENRRRRNSEAFRRPPPPREEPNTFQGFLMATTADFFTNRPLAMSAPLIHMPPADQVCQSSLFSFLSIPTPRSLLTHFSTTHS